MPSTRSAAKRLRQSLKRRLRNQAVKSAMRTAIRKCQQAARTDPAEGWRLYPTAQKAIDKAARKGVIHPRQAARRKSRLVAYLRRVSPAAPPAPAPESEPARPAS